MNQDFSYHFYSSTNSAWEGMYQEVLGATQSIYWEVYTFIDDITGNRFIDLLCEKSRQGVEVKIIVDAIGSLTLSQLSTNRLKAHGVEILFFNPLSPNLKKMRQWWNQVWLRNHCKVLIVDEKTVFIGGVNIRNYMESWDDLHLKISGKVIRPLVRYFAKKYIMSGGKRKSVKHLLHPKLAKGIGELKSKVNFIVNSPKYRYQRSPFKRVYRQALSIAKESFTLLTPYYAPDPRFLELIYKASKRGVKINVILPFKNDIKLMNYMARAFYGISKKAGASFYFLKNMNHGKAMTADNSLGMIGSANITPRSFYLNHEANVVFSEEDMVKDLNKILNYWKNEADPLLEMDFKRQGWSKRFKGWWAMQFKDHV